MNVIYQTHLPLSMTIMKMENQKIQHQNKKELKPGNINSITLKTMGYPNSDFLFQKNICIPENSDIYQQIVENYQSGYSTNQPIPEDAFSITNDGLRCIIGIISDVSGKSTSNMYQVQFGYTGIPNMTFQAEIL